MTTAGPPCPNCHKPTLAVCMSCRGRAGGEAKTIRKLEAASENIKAAIAANRGRRSPADKRASAANRGRRKRGKR